MIEQSNARGRYRHDSLDRLVAVSDLQGTTERFYLKDRIHTQVAGDVRHSIVETESLVLAAQRFGPASVATALLLSDKRRSTLGILPSAPTQVIAHAPYGHCPQAAGLLSLPSFCGELPDRLTGHYPLGRGYREYNPVVGRFNSPDSESPFSKGGLNPYAFCLNDPINRTDPSGHASIFGALKFIGKVLGLRVSKKAQSVAKAYPVKEKVALGYHGTSRSAGDNILHNGPNPDLFGMNQGGGALAAGHGFYLSKSLTEAKGYAEVAARRWGQAADVLKVYKKPGNEFIENIDFEIHQKNTNVLSVFPQSLPKISFARVPLKQPSELAQQVRMT